MPRCPRCATEYAPGVRFCPNDGADLLTGPAPERTCPTCGARYPADRSFCAVDGTPLAAAAPTAVAAPAPAPQPHAASWAEARTVRLAASVPPEAPDGPPEPLEARPVDSVVPGSAADVPSTGSEGQEDQGSDADSRPVATPRSTVLPAPGASLGETATPVGTPVSSVAGIGPAVPDGMVLTHDGRLLPVALPQATRVRAASRQAPRLRPGTRLAGMAAAALLAGVLVGVAVFVAVHGVGGLLAALGAGALLFHTRP